MTHREWDIKSITGKLCEDVNEVWPLCNLVKLSCFEGHLDRRLKKDKLILDDEWWKSMHKMKFGGAQVRSFVVSFPLEPSQPCSRQLSVDGIVFFH